MARAQAIQATVKGNKNSGSLILGTGLAFASLILVPAFATSIGLGQSVTGALRMALMKASNRAINSTNSTHGVPASQR